MRLFGLLLSIAVLARGVPVSQDDSVLRLVASNFVDCANSDLSLCLKEHALRATERLGTVRKLKITDGITIYNTSPKEARSLDTLPTDPEERNKQVTARLWEKTSDLLTRSEVELSFSGSDDEEESRALSNEVEEGRKKKKKETKKKIKMLLPLVLLAKAKAIALVVFSIVLIAVSIAKLALLAKIAFIFKAISAVKQLLAKKGQHEEVEHWAAGPPVEDHGHAQGWEGGWSRSKKDANNMAYAAYRK